MKKPVVLNHGDYNAIISTLRDVRYDIVKLPESYCKDRIAAAVERIGRILTYKNGSEDEGGENFNKSKIEKALTVMKEE